MGLFDLLRPKKEKVVATRSALDAARDPQADSGPVNHLIQMLLNLGLDGKGPLSSSTELAAKARGNSTGPEASINWVVRRSLVGGGIGGFATGIGGFVTMPVSLPVNVLEFYVQATRMVGAIATLRGYDVHDQQIRTAVLLTLVGSNAEDVLKKAGMSTGTGRVAGIALRNMPPAALMVVNKAIGFRLLRGVGEKALSRLGRGVPVVGGFIGAGIDGYMMKKIADHAKTEFPPRPVAATVQR